MIQGLRTVIYPVTDLAAGKEWYSQILQKKPYFDQPFYAGFDVGGFELGLIPDGKPNPDGPLPYWGVEDCAAELARLTALGARLVDPAHEVGGGIYVAAVSDPFGNTFGIIQNPHFSLEKVR